MISLRSSVFLLFATLSFHDMMASPTAAQAPLPAANSNVAGRFFLARSSDFGVSATIVHYDPLLREILRQALIADLRERYAIELGDAWLGDAPPPADSPDQTLDIVMSPGKTNLVEILRGVAPHQSSLARFGLTMPEKQPLTYVQFLSEVDRLVREEVGAKTAEIVGVRGLRAAAEPIDPATLQATTVRLEALIDELTLPTQFAAARELHALLRRHGEVPEFVGLLIRAYAHLGLFAEPFCSRLPYSFKARALVYAQRWLTREPQSSLAVEHRAYALALFGLQKSAIEDLAESARRAGEQGPAVRYAGRWSPLIAAYCRYQMKTLAGASEKSPDRQLAALLRYMAAEATADGERIKTAVVDAQQTAPECYYLLDAFGHANAYSYEFEHSNFPRAETQRTLYESQRTALGSRLYARIQAMSGLPPSVAQTFQGYNAATTPPGDAAEYALRGRLIESLLAVPDAGEPLSWSLLGRLLQEEGFRQAMLSDEEDEQRHGDLPAAMLPLVAQHRLRPYFQLRNTRAPDRAEPESKLIAAIDLESIDRATMRLLFVLAPGDGTYNTAQASRMYGKASTASMTAGRALRDVFYHIAKDSPFAPQEYFLREILNVDPYCPRAVYFALKHYPAKYESQWESWKALSADHPEIEALLTVHLASKEPPAVQEAKLQTAFDAVPDAATALRLSELQLQRNDLDAWEQTLRIFVAKTGKTDEALKICLSAADELKKRRLFERALPFAEAAYEHNPWRGQGIVGQLYEALQRWEDAERVVKQASQGDPNFPFEWYFFCRRTGQGDSAAAFDLADKFMQRSPGTNWTAYYRRLQNENERAASGFRGLSGDGDPEYGLHAVLLHDQLGLTAERDQLLKTLRERGPKFKHGETGKTRVRTGLVGLAKLIENDLKNGGKAEFDLVALEKLRTDAPLDQADFDCVLGYYYDQHGQPAKAVEAWLRCMAATDIDAPARTLAGAKLWDRSVSPAEYRDALHGRRPAENKSE